MYPQHLGSSYNTYTTAIHQDRTRQGQHVHNSAAQSTHSTENNALKLYSTVINNSTRRKVLYTVKLEMTNCNTNNDIN